MNNHSTLDDNIVYSKAPILIKLSFLSVSREHIPKWCAFLSFIISNLQTIALLLNNTRLYLPKQNDVAGAVILAYLKIFGFADFFSFTNRTLVFIWSAIMLAYCLHFIILLFYLSLKLKMKLIIPDYIQKYCSIMNYFHPLIFFYPIHTFNLRVIQGYRLGTFTENISAPAMLLFYANIFINFLLAFLSTRLFYVVIKTKDPLSCKNNSIRTNDLISKTVSPILWAFAEDNKFMQISVLVNGIVDCIRRDFALIWYLPYYSVEILYVSALMQGGTTALALLIIIAKTLSYTTLNLGQYFVHFSWIVMIPLMAKLYYSFIRVLLGRITFAKSSSLDLHYAIQKRYLLKYLLKIRVPPTSETKNFNIRYFVFRGILSQPESPASYSPLQNHNEVTNKTFQDIRDSYCELVSRYPKSHVAKLTLANYYVKKEGAYLLANNLIEEVLNDSPSFSVRVSLSMIRFELQRKTFLQYSHQEGENLNVLHYVQTTSLNAQLKQQIKHQIRKQLKFWENFSSNKPDMGYLTELAIKIDKEGKAVFKTWKEFSKIRPCTFYSSPLVFGMYTSMINNNQIDGEKFIEQYNYEILSSRKLLEVDDLNNDTMMATDTVRITMSGSRKKIGYILDCSTNIGEVYGWKKEFLIKQPIITIMPPYYQHKHDKFLLNHFNTGKTKLLNKTSILPVIGSDGYVKPSRVHIKMHPFVEQGISYVAVLRKINEPQRRMLLIRKDGIIDAMSKNFAIDMNIAERMKPLDICSFCAEFRVINSTFNKKALIEVNENSDKSGSDDPLDDEESSSLTENRLNRRSASQNSILNPDEMTLYNVFTANGGSQLTFYPRGKSRTTPKNKAQPKFYKAQIVTRIHGNDWIKVVSLDWIENEEANHQNTEQEYTPKSPTDFSRRDQNQDNNKKPENFLAGQVSSNRRLLSPSFKINSQERMIKFDLPKTESDVFEMTIPEELEYPSGKIISKKKNSPLKDDKVEPLPLERKKLLKLKHQETHPYHNQSMSVTDSTLSSRDKKTQGLVTKALNTTVYKKAAIFFCAGFFMFNVLIFFLQIIECISIVGVVNNIKSKTNVMANGAFRLNSFISLGMYARSWYQAMQDDDLPESVAYVSKSLASMYSVYAKDAYKYDTLLREQVSEIDEKYQKEFYVKNIRIYETETLLLGHYSNFDAAGLLIDHSIRFMVDQISSNYSKTNFDDVQFVLTNLYNDFLISGETATGLLITDIEDTLDSASTSTAALYALIVIVNVGFFGIVLKYFHHVWRDSRSFAFRFFRLNLKEIELVRTVLKQFIHALDTNVSHLMEINKSQTEAVKKPSSETEKVNFRRPSMRRLLKKQIIVFMRLLPVFIIIMIWTMSYFISTTNILSELEQQQLQIRNSLTNVIEQSLLIVEFLELVCTNSTATIVNLPIQESFLVSVEDLKDVGQFIDHFRDSKGELSPEEHAVFFSFPCSDFANYGLELSDTLVSYCQDLSYGMEETSFTTLNAQLYTSITDYYSQFMASNRTMADVKQVFQNTATQFLSLALVAPSMCTILYKTTMKDFESKTHSAKENAILFSSVTIFGISGSAFLVWFFVLKSILRLESYNKLILKLVPVKLILANPHLKQYLLIQNSNIDFDFGRGG